MKKNIYISLLLLFICSNNVFAQEEGTLIPEESLWYFGYNTGLNFNTNRTLNGLNVSTSPATAIQATDLPTLVPTDDSRIYTREGCFVVSDVDGDLVFYSDGITVYNRNNDVALNGTGLLGDPSGTQSGMAIPRPGSLTQYYIVTSPEVTTGTVGVRYSVYDITLDNGNGGIVNGQKNIQINDFAYENIVSIPDPNGSRYWLITKGGNSSVNAGSQAVIRCYEVSAAGIGINVAGQTPAASSQITHVNWGTDMVGEGFCSPDGTRVVFLGFGDSQIISFNFNPSTGTMSNGQHLIFRCSANTAAATALPYAGCFTPNGEFLYFTGFTNNALYRMTWDNLRTFNGQTVNLTQINDPTTAAMQNIKRCPRNQYLYGILGPERASGTTLGHPNVFATSLYRIANSESNSPRIQVFRDFFDDLQNNPSLGTPETPAYWNAYSIGLPAIGLPSFARGNYSTSAPLREFVCVDNNSRIGINIPAAILANTASIRWQFGDGSPSEVIAKVGTSAFQYSPLHTYIGDLREYTVVVTFLSSTNVALQQARTTVQIMACDLKTNPIIRTDLQNEYTLKVRPATP